jgi:two-component system, chemotaxis family, sensor kinase CheA
VMAVRAQPFTSIFERLPRLVRELSDQLGKDINFVMAGGEIEIDKSVVEQLIDPIVHIIRNAADHGVESSDERAKVKKPAKATISLSARQNGTRVEISISDDGRGLDLARIRSKAVECRLIAPDASLSDEQVEQLIFLPGFSTASAVTTISGRGVGMDVVKKNIQKLGGKIRVSSTIGAGTTFTLSLPVTLAVVEGMVVRSGQDLFVIPTRSIVECRSNWLPESVFIQTVGHILNVRSQNLPVISLGQLFNKCDGLDQSSIAIIVQVTNGSNVVLVVNEIVGQQQVVAKQIATQLGDIKGIAGLSVLADGSLAFIVDLDEASTMRSNSEIKFNQDQRETFSELAA